MDTTTMVAALKAYGADTTGTLERFMGDADLYMDCIRLFQQNPGLDRLSAALDSKDYLAAFEAAHNMKGVLANLGLTPILNAVCDIVESLRNQNHCEDARLAAQYQAVEQEYQRLLTFL